MMTRNLNYSRNSLNAGGTEDLLLWPLAVFRTTLLAASTPVSLVGIFTWEGFRIYVIRERNNIVVLHAPKAGFIKYLRLKADVMKSTSSRIN